jgi:hypothetical protein
MLIQEPYCYKGKTCLIPQKVDKIGHEDNPRAYILASKGLAISKVTHLCARDYAVGLTKLGGKQTLVVSAYLDILLTPISRELIDIIQFADRRRFALLIAVDSNAHSKLWMSKDNNSRGRIITDYIIENNLKVENKGSEPTFECSTGRSIIDLTLSRGLKLQINGWKVCKADNHSDHHTIKYQLLDEILELPPTRPWDKADWAMFSTEVSKKAIRLPEYINSGVVEKLVEQLYDCIDHAIDKACPKTKAAKVVLSNPWFTKGLLSKRKEVFALWDKYIANKSQDNWNKYKTKRKNYKKHCDKVKRKYRNNYKEKLGDTKSMANFVQGEETISPGLYL